jgi:hypothetical protein
MKRAASVFVLASAMSLLAGCGATFNGMNGTVTVKSDTPGAEILVNGGLAGKGSATFTTSNHLEQTVIVRAPGYEPKTVALEPKVSVAAVVCDVLWSLTIIGVAAPLSDLALDTFEGIGPRDLNVTLSPKRTARR